MLSLFALWVPLALPVQEPKGAPPANATDHGQRTTDNSKPVWTPRDKEMIVLLGSAFIEQEARDGYLETELIRLFPNKDIRVRNLGWSGDTVHCQARAYFGPPQEGFDRLRSHLAMIKPTTVICCYGANESWKGEPGIVGFRKGYEKLIDMIRETTGATVVLMTPPRYEEIGPRLIELRAANVRLKRYSQEVRYVAEGRKCFDHDFGYFFSPEWDPEKHRVGMSDNGVDLTGRGYELASQNFWPAAWSVELTLRPLEVEFEGEMYGFVSDRRRHQTDTSIDGKTLRWTMIEHRLPSLSWSSNHIRLNPIDAVFECRIDGKPLGKRFKEVIPFKSLPEVQQLEKLRLAIIKKNALFFHRWRPANETYLYGFRKHEQGNNGVEPPMFDKLVEEAEAEIARLKKPVPHKYELIRIEEKK